ncbi:hypothetical protein KJ761_02215 [Patescibacteria group bacterium]|nr:hypothetical protein [Patescibacteria group bacterium]
MFEQPSQPTRAIWLALLVVALAMLVFFVLIQRDKKTATPEQPITANPSQTETTSVPSTSPSVSMEEAQKQFQTIQDQVNAGTLSSEEAEKQMDALGAQIAPPDLPAEAEK